MKPDMAHSGGFLNDRTGLCFFTCHAGFAFALPRLPACLSRSGQSLAWPGPKAKFITSPFITVSQCKFVSLRSIIGKK